MIAIEKNYSQVVQLLCLHGEDYFSLYVFLYLKTSLVLNKPEKNSWEYTNKDVARSAAQH